MSFTTPPPFSLLTTPYALRFTLSLAYFDTPLSFHSTPLFHSSPNRGMQPAEEGQRAHGVPLAGPGEQNTHPSSLPLHQQINSDTTAAPPPVVLDDLEDFDDFEHVEGKPNGLDSHLKNGKCESAPLLGVVENGLSPKATDRDEPDDEEGSGKYRHRGWERWLGWLLCRNDVAEEPLECEPVPFTHLFRFASTRDRVLMAVGIMLAIFCGACKPLFLVFSGRLTDILLEAAHSGKESEGELVGKATPYIVANAVCGLVLTVAVFISYLAFKVVCVNVTETLRRRFIESLMR